VAAKSSPAGLHYRKRRETLRRRWRPQVEAVGGPSADSLGDDVEGSCRKFASLITTAVNWRSKTLVPGAERISATGFLRDPAQTEADAHFAMLDRVQRVHRIVEETLPLAFAA
jgi:type II secretory pathway component PulJ